MSIQEQQPMANEISDAQFWRGEWDTAQLVIAEKDKRIKELEGKLDMIDVGMSTVNDAAGKLLAEFKAKDKLIAELKDQMATDIEWLRHKQGRIAQLEALLTECMRVMGLYINVPEFDDLRDRWDKLKSQ